MTEPRTGARVLLETAAQSGVRVCFANPGTTELGLVRALDEVPSIRPVLGLAEGVCTGAADGYARVSGQPALTLLHLGPGLANGLANLHNARRAHSPILNVVGQHATWHLPFDAPLTSDIASLARPMSDKVLQVTRAVGTCMQRAVRQSMTAPGAVVTLIAPSDLMDGPCQEPAAQPRAKRAVRHRAVPAERLAEVAGRLSSATRPVLLLGAEALRAGGLLAARRVAERVGGRLLMETYPALVEIGGDLPRLERLAYFPQDVLTQLGEATVVLVGARVPVSYFGYEGQPSELVPAARLAILSDPAEDSVLALEALASLLPSAAAAGPAPVPDVPAPESTLTPRAVAEGLIACLPQSAIVSLEGSTCGSPYLQQAHRAPRHSVMTNTGGAIGQGIPCALGAALAQPDRRIVCLQSDGGAQYTIQALWTLARERLNVTVIICANHRYGILQTELRRAGARLDSPATNRLTSLDDPRLDWVALAKGYGVEGERTNTPEMFRSVLARALRAPGPYLIEAQLN